MNKPMVAAPQPNQFCGKKGVVIQNKPKHNLALEKRPAPPVYRPYPAGAASQPKMNVSSAGLGRHGRNGAMVCPRMPGGESFCGNRAAPFTLPSVQRSTGSPGQPASRRVALSIQLCGTRWPSGIARFAPPPGKVATAPSTIQRVSVNIVPFVADESGIIVGRLIFNNRPPTNKQVRDQVNRLNHEGDSQWQVGHMVGWELIAWEYEQMFTGKTIGELDVHFKSKGFGSQPTIKMIEACIGHWIDTDYKSRYAENEFPQEVRPNLSAGGKVPHLKGEYEADYNSGVRSSASPAHAKVKRSYVATQVNRPENMDAEGGRQLFEQTKSIWDQRYPQSPLREDEFS